MADAMKGATRACSYYLTLVLLTYLLFLVQGYGGNESWSQSSTNPANNERI
jgi:hypothetical protein